MCVTDLASSVCPRMCKQFTMEEASFPERNTHTHTLSFQTPEIHVHENIEVIKHQRLLSSSIRSSWRETYLSTDEQLHKTHTFKHLTKQWDAVPHQNAQLAEQAERENIKMKKRKTADTKSQYRFHKQKNRSILGKLQLCDSPQIIV